MWTSHEISRNRSQSNRFHYTKNPEENITLGFQTEIYTRTLTTPYLDPKRVRRLELLSELHKQGVTDGQMSLWFNDLGILTPQNKQYTPSLIWITRKKWEQRKVRENDTCFVIYPPQFYLIERIRK